MLSLYSQNTMLLIFKEQNAWLEEPHKQQDLLRLLQKLQNEES